MQNVFDVISQTPRSNWDSMIWFARAIVPAAITIAGCVPGDATSPRSRSGDTKDVVVSTSIAFVKTDGSLEVQPQFTTTRQAHLVHDGLRFVEDRSDLARAGVNSTAPMSSLLGPDVDVEMPVLSFSSASGGADYPPNETNRSGDGVVGVRTGTENGPLTDIIAHDASGAVNFAMQMNWQKDGDTWIASTVRVRARIDTTTGSEANSPSGSAPRIPGDVQAIELTSQVYEAVSALPKPLPARSEVADVLALLVRLGTHTVLPATLHAQVANSPVCEKAFGPILFGAVDLGTPCRNYAAKQAAETFNVVVGAALTAGGNKLAQILVAKGVGERIKVGVAVQLLELAGLPAVGTAAAVVGVSAAIITSAVFAHHLSHCPVQDLRRCRGAIGGGQATAPLTPPGPMGSGCSLACDPGSFRALMNGFWPKPMT